MTSRVAFPFLVLPDEAISFEGWKIGDPGLPLADAEDTLEDWDYARDLELGTSIAIDWRLVAQALRLPIETLRLRIVLTAGTGTGSLPRRIDRLREEVIDMHTETLALSSIVHGSALSGRLRLCLEVLLEDAGVGTNQLSPTVRGSRLWKTAKDILIEDGGDSRFPVETVSFATMFQGLPQASSPWYLHWRPDSLQADFSGSVRLYVNSDNEEVLARFVAGDALSIQAIFGDVISQMADTVLDREDCLEALAACEPGSVGSQVRHWLELAFPDQAMVSVQAVKNQFPGRFRAAILASADLGVPG